MWPNSGFDVFLCEAAAAPSGSGARGSTGAGPDQQGALISLAAEALGSKKDKRKGLNAFDLAAQRAHDAGAELSAANFTSVCGAISKGGRVPI